MQQAWHGIEEETTSLDACEPYGPTILTSSTD